MQLLVSFFACAFLALNACGATSPIPTQPLEKVLRRQDQLEKKSDAGGEHCAKGNLFRFLTRYGLCPRTLIRHRITKTLFKDLRFGVNSVR